MLLQAICILWVYHSYFSCALILAKMIKFHCKFQLNYFFRVFLRAINKFSETMNQKFLENMNFEEQVSTCLIIL